MSECKVPLVNHHEIDGKENEYQKLENNWVDQQTGITRKNSKNCYIKKPVIPHDMPNDNHAIVLYVGENYESRIYNLGPLVDRLLKQNGPYRDPNSGIILTDQQVQFINDKYKPFSQINQNVLPIK